MSAIGSVIVISASPARFRDPRDLTRVGELPQTDPTEAELAVVRARAAASFATVVFPGRELRRPLLLFDQTLLRHAYSVLNGKPSAFSNARASSSVRAVVTMVMCMPRTFD